MKHPILVLYGLAVIALSGWTQYGGWGNVRLSEIKKVPKSVRDNPGAYRSHYGYGSRYFGGK
jgi:hypothetical protein